LAWLCELFRGLVITGDRGVFHVDAGFHMMGMAADKEA
jgi:hypothetical protein